jgi:hypothetical protein
MAYAIGNILEIDVDEFLLVVGRAIIAVLAFGIGFASIALYIWSCKTKV